MTYKLLANCFKYNFALNISISLAKTSGYTNPLEHIFLLKGNFKTTTDWKIVCIQHDLAHSNKYLRKLDIQDS